MNRHDWTSGKEIKKAFIPPTKEEQEKYLKAVRDEAIEDGTFDRIMRLQSEMGEEAAGRYIASGQFSRDVRGVGPRGIRNAAAGNARGQLTQQQAGAQTAYPFQALRVDNMVTSPVSREYSSTQKTLATLFIIVSYAVVSVFFEASTGMTEPRLWVFTISGILNAIVAVVAPEMATRKPVTVATDGPSNGGLG